MRISDWSSDVCSSDLEGAEVIATLGERILGRSASIDIKHPLSGEVLMKAGELIEERDVDRIETAGVESALIRSVLTCDSEVGVCGKCYGRDMARGTPVNIGEAVGVLAAQSHGEPENGRGSGGERGEPCV